MKEITNKLVEDIKRNSNKDKAAWLENYVKHDIKSIGVGIPILRKILEDNEKKFNLSKCKLSDQSKLLDTLMSDEITEFKLAAIIYMQLYWNEVDNRLKLKIISDWFDKRWIFDWNVCDWLCVRLFAPIFKTDEQLLIKEIEIWNSDNFLWKARASLVAFISIQNPEKFKNVIKEFSTILIKREERFSKTAVGWLLREISKSDHNFVTKFITKNIYFFTLETISNSLKYYPKDKSHFIAQLRSI